MQQSRGIGVKVTNFTPIPTIEGTPTQERNEALSFGALQTKTKIRKPDLPITS